MRDKRRTSSRSGSGRRLSATTKTTHPIAPWVLEYQGSASSAAFPMSADEGPDQNGFVFLNADDTEAERAKTRKRGQRDLPPAPERRADSPRPLTSMMAATRDRVAAKRVPTDVAQHPLPARITLLPRTIGVGPLQYTVTRRRCETGLLLSAVVVGIVRLAYTWNERAVAGGELLLTTTRPES